MPDSTQPTDAFVVFGITGDLARVMTFRSLYRLERRGVLNCPVIGVAADDWTVDQLVERARQSIVATGEPLDEKVFARFHTARPEGEEFGAHSGLGLAIARTIAEAHDGSLTVTDRPGGQPGACLVLELPAA